MIYVFLADGFEIIEALAPVDMMTRAKLDVKTVGVTGAEITSSCGVIVKPDVDIKDINIENADAIVLPGGMPGTLNLENSKDVQNAIDYAVENDKYVCAICAAPSILGHKGLLQEKEATCFPGFEDALDGVKLSKKYVAVDGRIITARGAGVSVDFGLEIVKALKGEAEAERIRKAIQCQ